MFEVEHARKFRLDQIITHTDSNKPSAQGKFNAEVRFEGSVVGVHMFPKSKCVNFGARAV